MALIYFKKKLFIFNGTHFIAESGSYTKDQDLTLRYPSESNDPYRVDFGERKIEVTLSDVPLEYDGTDVKKLFDDAYVAQEDNADDLPNLEMYDYKKSTGEMKVHDVFVNCAISKLEYKSEDDLYNITMNALYLQKK